VVVAGDEKRLGLGQHAAHAGQVFEANLAFTTQVHQALGGAQADTWDARNKRGFGAVQIKGKHLTMLQGPSQLGVDIQRQMAGAFEQFIGAEAIAAQQEIRLVQTVLTHQRRRGQGHAFRAVGDGAERRVIHAAQLEVAIQRLGAVQDGAVIGIVGADDHLRALPSRGETRGARFVEHGLFAGVDGLHGLLDGDDLFFRRQGVQAGLGGQFDVHAQPVGVAPGFGDKRRVGVGNGLEVDIAAEVMLFTQ